MIQFFLFLFQLVFFLFSHVLSVHQFEWHCWKIKFCWKVESSSKLNLMIRYTCLPLSCLTVDSMFVCILLLFVTTFHTKDRYSNDYSSTGPTERANLRRSSYASGTAIKTSVCNWMITGIQQYADTFTHLTTKDRQTWKH